MIVRAFAEDALASQSSFARGEDPCPFSPGRPKSAVIHNGDGLRAMHAQQILPRRSVPKVTPVGVLSPRRDTHLNPSFDDLSHEVGMAVPVVNLLLHGRAQGWQSKRPDFAPHGSIEGTANRPSSNSTDGTGLDELQDASL